MKQLKTKIIASVITMSMIVPMALAGGMTASQVRVLQQQNKKTNIEKQQQQINAKKVNIEQNQQKLNNERNNIERNIQSIQKQQIRQLEKSYNTFKK